MKKFLIFAIITLLSLSVNAQKYYTKDDVTVSWKYWSDLNSWDWLISNGKKITINCFPHIVTDGMNLINPPEIIATYCRNNKFIVLKFNEENSDSQHNGIRITTNIGDTHLSKVLPTYSYLEERPWYEIDFENIIYEPMYDRIMIPIGIDENGYHNAICIDFAISSGIPQRQNEIQHFDENKVKYYNLLGEEVDIDNVSGQIVIKTDGKMSQKIFK